MNIYFCSHCQKLRQHRIIKSIWIRNLKKIAVHLVCTKCDLENVMWLEDKKENKL